MLMFWGVIALLVLNAVQMMMENAGTYGKFAVPALASIVIGVLANAFMKLQAVNKSQEYSIATHSNRDKENLCRLSRMEHLLVKFSHDRNLQEWADSLLERCAVECARMDLRLVELSESGLSIDKHDIRPGQRKYEELERTIGVLKSDLENEKFMFAQYYELLQHHQTLVTEGLKYTLNLKEKNYRAYLSAEMLKKLEDAEFVKSAAK